MPRIDDVAGAHDDASRLTYTEILPDEREASAIALLERGSPAFARHGATVGRIMTDTASPIAATTSATLARGRT